VSAAEVQALTMTRVEAQRAVERMKYLDGELRREIYDFRRRRGWVALGYTSFDACLSELFGKHRSRIYQELAAAEIEVHIDDSKSTVVDKPLLIGSIPERTLRPLTEIKDNPEKVREAWDLALSRTDGKPTGRAVEEAVAELKARDEGQAPPASIAREVKEPDERPSRPSFNETNEMVDWARWTWNPVTWCEHTCIYCYARDIANRFYAEGFKPTFRPERLDAPRHSRIPFRGQATADPIERTAWRNVFVCSMADLFGRWVPDEWIEAVFDSCRQSPGWNYLFLTKFPQRYVGLDFPATAWVGTSVDEQKRVANAERAFRRIDVPVKWLSVEPMREPLEFTDLSMFDWVVIGGQSRSSGAPEFFPEKRWVVRLINRALDAGCKVYCKPNTDPAGRWAGIFKEYPEAFDQP
jgi:protein gp37